MKGKTNSNIAELVKLLLFLQHPQTLQEISENLDCSLMTAERRIREIRQMGFAVAHTRRYLGQWVCIHEYQIDFHSSQIPDWRELARLIGSGVPK